MERIGSTGRSSNRPSSRSERKSKSQNSTPASFSKVLDDAESHVEPTDFDTSVNESRDVSLEAMLDEIYSYGDAVKKDQTKQNVLRYKKAVKRFMKIVLDRGLSVSETKSSPNILRQKRYTLVRVIDEKLERLASGVMQTQKNTFHILGKIDEINGLLVDLSS